MMGNILAYLRHKLSLDMTSCSVYERRCTSLICKIITSFIPKLCLYSFNSLVGPHYEEIEQCREWMTLSLICKFLQMCIMLSQAIKQSMVAATATQITRDYVSVMILLDYNSSRLNWCTPS